MGPLVRVAVTLLRFLNMPVQDGFVVEVFLRKRKGPWLAFDSVHIRGAEDARPLRDVTATGGLREFGHNEVAGPSAPGVLVVAKQHTIDCALLPFALPHMHSFPATGTAPVLRKE